MLQSKKFKITSLFLAVLVVINGYLLFKNNDIIEKKYYANEALFASLDIHTKELEKNAVITAGNTHYVGSYVQSIGEVLVTKGQTVAVMDELAIFKEDELDRIDSEIAAYEKELSELNTIVSDLEDEGGYSSPSASTDSTSIGDSGFWNLGLSIELGIEQETPTAEGVAIIERHIAETQRQIDILNSVSEQIASNNALTTPVEGIVEDIILDGDAITFVIQTTPKKVVLYVDSKEWKDVAINQPATVVINEGADDELIVEGTVIQKQEIPARESIAYDVMRKHEKINEDETIYEVSIEPFDFLLDTPIGEFAKATIVTNEAPNSYEVPAEWVVKYDVEAVSDQHIYTIGYDGLTRLEPVTVEFEHKTEIVNGWLEEETIEDEIIEEEIVEEEPIEEEMVKPTEPRVITVDLTEEAVEEETDKDSLQEAKVITAPLENNVIFLSGDEKNIMAPVFRPYPIQTYKWDRVGEVTWRDVLFFMLP